jgi:hypothetical protein
MARVFDLTSGKESDDEQGLPGEPGSAKPRKRAKIKPSPLEKSWVRSTVTVGLFVVVVASIAFLIFYLRPRGNVTNSEPETSSEQIVGGRTSDNLGPPLKDANPGALGPPKGAGPKTR